MNLRARWNTYTEAHPRPRIRDAAQAMSVSEAELVAAGCGGDATRLRGPFPAIVNGLRSVGEVMALTRHQHAVHEVTGTYTPVKGSPHVGLVIGGPIDLRLFWGQWAHAYSVTTERHESIQFFDAQGDAIHKVYRTADTDAAAWASLRAAHADPGAEQPVVLPAPSPAADNDSVDRDTFLSDWAALQDTHEFFGMLRRHGVSRSQALTLAEGRFAHRLPSNAASRLLTAAAGRAVPIMVFVGNRGCIQIFSGTVSRIVPTGSWINVLDPGFNLHLRESGVTQAWLVRKPTADGVVTSVELLDGRGSIVARFFGARKPGSPELPAWRAMAEEIAVAACEAD